MPSRWGAAVVVGASSGIGAEVARQLARDGTRVAVVARREGELRRLAAESGGDASVRVYPHDVTHYDEVPGLFQRIEHDLGGLDLVVYAAGILPRVRGDEYAFEKDRAVVEVNLLGAVAWLNEAAMTFARLGAGTIVGISSTAADRGRRVFPVYGASKAALDTYLEALRNRLTVRGVRVVTIKPGPVDTPMTAKPDRHLPFMISAEAAARQLLAGVRRGARVVYVPARWRPIMFVIRHIPSRLFSRLDL